MEIRTIRLDEWRELRDIRLRALLDAPDAFGAIFVEEAVDPDEAWQHRAHRPDGTMIVAVNEGKRLGRIGPGIDGERGVEESQALAAMSALHRVR